MLLDLESDNEFLSHSPSPPAISSRSASPATKVVFNRVVSPIEIRRCRICHEESFGNNKKLTTINAEQELISPCWCKGTMAWVHRSCLDAWRNNSVATASNAVSSFNRHLWTCQQCLFDYQIETPSIFAKVLNSNATIFIISLMRLFVMWMSCILFLVCLTLLWETSLSTLPLTRHQESSPSLVATDSSGGSFVYLHDSTYFIPTTAAGADSYENILENKDPKGTLREEFYPTKTRLKQSQEIYIENDNVLSSFVNAVKTSASGIYAFLLECMEIFHFFYYETKTELFLISSLFLGIYGCLLVLYSPSEEGWPALLRKNLISRNILFNSVTPLGSLFFLLISLSVTRIEVTGFSSDEPIIVAIVKSIEFTGSSSELESNSASTAAKSIFKLPVWVIFGCLVIVIGNLRLLYSLFMQTRHELARKWQSSLYRVKNLRK